MIEIYLLKSLSHFFYIKEAVRKPGYSRYKRKHFEMVCNFVYQNLEIKSADKAQQLRDHLPKANKIQQKKPQYLISETDMLDCFLKNQSNEAIIRASSKPCKICGEAF